MPDELAASPEQLADAPKPLSLREGIAWTGLGNVVYLASQYIMLMVVAKFGDAERVGQFSLAFAIAAPVFIFSQMNLRQLQVTDAKNEYSFSDYFWLRILSTLVAMLAIAAIALLSGYSSTMMWLILIVGFAKAAESMSDIALGQMQRNERMDMAALSLLIKGVVSCGVFILVMWRTHDLVLSAAGMAVSWLMVLMVYDMPMQSRLNHAHLSLWPFRLNSIGRLTLLAVPLAAAGLGSLSTNMPRYFLEYYHGKTAVAHFSVAVAPLALITLLAGAVGQATLARAGKYFQMGQMDSFKRLALKVTALQFLIGFAFIVGSVTVGERLLSALFTPEYSSNLETMAIMAVGMTLGSLGALGAIAVSASRKTYFNLILIVVTLAVQVPACWYLVSKHGVLGAGWADCTKYAIATLTLLAMGIVLCRNKKIRV